MSQQYNISSGQTVYDALVAVQVPLDSIVEVLMLSDIGIDDLEPEFIAYESSNVVIVKGGKANIVVDSENLIYEADPSQNIFDLALVTYGDLNKIVDLLLTNSSEIDSINYSLHRKINVNYKNSEVTENTIVAKIKSINNGVFTGDLDIAELLLEDEYYLLQENGGTILL
jgi:hypothetical protein